MLLLLLNHFQVSSVAVLGAALMGFISLKNTFYRSTIIIISSYSQVDMKLIGNTVVGGIKSQPPISGNEYFDPSVFSTGTA